MSKEQFSEKLSLNKENKARLEIVNKIILEYTTQGYRLTLRQLYYQLVSRDIIPNIKQKHNATWNNRRYKTIHRQENKII